MSIKEKILITGAAGFIGAALVKKLLSESFEVVGIDNLDGYYDINLKKSRLYEIEKAKKEFKSKWILYNDSIEHLDRMNKIFEKEKPEIVVNLAAQAGVRYSLTNPHCFNQTNVVGFGNILENCRLNNVKHLIYASSSSVYGGNELLPYKEKQSVNHPVSLYAATKKQMN